MKSLTSILSAIALTLVPVSASPLFSGPDLRPITERPGFTEETREGQAAPGIPRVVMEKGMMPTTNWACLGELVPATRYTLTIMEGERPGEIIPYLTAVGVPQDELRMLLREDKLEEMLGQSPFDKCFLTRPLAEKAFLNGVMYGNCPAKPTPPPVYISGVVATAETFNNQTRVIFFDRDKIRELSLPSTFRINPGERIGVYNSRGLPSEGNIAQYEVFQLLKKEGGIRFSYVP